MRYQRSLYLIMFLCCSSLLASCSGDGLSGSNQGGSVTLSALILPERVSVVDPKSISGSGKPSLLAKWLSSVTTDLPLTSDYRTDNVTVYVNERSLDSFQSVNDILCSIRQTRYDVMLNMGPYHARVDKNLCSANRSDAASAGQASTNQTGGASMPFYEDWTVNSFRASESSPHIVQIWVHSVERNGPPKFIQAKLVITEGSSTANPYGIFTANFSMFDPATDPGLTSPLAYGFLNADRVTTASTNTVLLHFAQEDKDSFFIDKATLFKTPDGKSGAGTAFRAESPPGNTPKATRFNLAYDQDHFLRTENSGTSVCLDRNNFQISAWRYGLYTVPTDTSAAPGSRVNRNSNFQVKKQNGDYGSIGYWGAWFPNNGTVNNGDTVLKHDYTTNTDTAFTVFAREGKLKKYTKSNITLADIKSVPLVFFYSGNQYLLAWDDSGKVFWIFAQMGANGSWQSISPVVLDLSALNWVEMMFWSQSLGGSVIVKLPAPGTNAPSGDCTGTGPFNCTGKATSTTPVVYFKESLIFPGDTVPTRLACFDRCPDASVLDTPAPFHTDVSYQTVTPALATYTSYSFDSANMLLTESVTALPVTSTTVTNPFENGITSGLLFEPSLTNLNALACDWNPGNTCAGKAWSSPTISSFYVWETGPNSWNHFVTVRDAAGPVKFDPPLQIKYLHSQPSSTAPDYKYNGVTFFLQYQGFGDLQGIPGKCVNIDTGGDADCSQGGNSIRWVPEFTIPRTSLGGTLTEVTDMGRGVNYFVKPLEMEQRMTSLAVSACTGAGLTTAAYELPSMMSFRPPKLGPEPVVHASPAVVGGVIQ